jgi:probable F420-dependent oxidoreductase
VHIGISRPPTPPHPVPDVDGAIIAKHVEEAGFESLFYGEHPIRPVDQVGVGVHADGVPFFQDTLVTLSRASATTTTLRLGGGVFLLPEHNPVQFAKELATLDFYSGGRVIVGCGVGWSKVECELLGGHWERRWAQSCESIRIMKKLWTEETVAFEGEFYRLPPVQLFPQPAQKSPPILLAGGSDRTFRRIVKVADGWIPAFASDEAVTEGPAVVAAGRRRLEQLATEVGRDPSEFEVTAIVRGGQVDGDLGPGQVVTRDLLRRYEDAGTDRTVISLPTVMSTDDARVVLERLSAELL